MKNNMRYIKQIGVFVLALVVSASCVKWEEETQPTMDAASTLTISVSAVADSSFTVQVSNSSAGYVALHLFQGSNNALPETDEEKEAFLTGNIVSMEYVSVQTAAGESYQVTFSDGIEQDMPYEVLAVAINADGVPSEGQSVALKTADSHPPVFMDSSPASGFDAIWEGDAIVLIYDEYIMGGMDTSFVFTSFYTGVEDSMATIFTMGNMVAVYPSILFEEGDYVFLSWSAGAITDMSGNPAEGMLSYYDEEYNFYGVYTRRVRPPREAVSVGPADADSLASGADIVITFDDAVYPDSYIDKSMISLSYYDVDGIPDVVEYIDPGLLTFDGVTVTIPQPIAADSGWYVELWVDEEAFDIGFYVPNAEIGGLWWTYE